MPKASDNAFKTLYNRLNKPQKEAVDSIEGPVMVIAGPGTGKTSILTLRIANILQKTDTPPHGILAITYTDAGVRAMREKLHGIIGNVAHEVKIHTFHSFAASIIANHNDHFLHLHGNRQMTDIEQETLVRGILTNEKFKDLRPLGRPDIYVASIISSIDEAKREALTAEMVVDYAKKEIKRIENDEESISTRGATKGKLKAEALEKIEKCKRTILFAEIYDLYEKRKREAKLMDFNDLIIELLVALRNDTLLLRLVQEQFLYIHIDEHQDTNDSQNFIVGIIAEFFDNPNIFIVGDEKQAIYRFQGASVENFLLLQKRFKGMKLISLDTNYRSHQKLLDASFSMIENNYEEDENKDLRIKLKSGQNVKAGKDKKNHESSEKISVIYGDDVKSTENYLISELKKIIENEPDKTVAIITRRNRELEHVVQLLESAGISIASEISVDIFHHPIGSLYFDLIGFVTDPARVDLLARTLVAGMWNKSFDKSLKIIQSLRSGLDMNIDRALPNLALIKKDLIKDSPIGFVINSAALSGFIDLVSRDPLYMDVWRGIVTLSESLIRGSEIKEPLKLIESLLAYRESAESKTVKVALGTSDLPIRAMTAHGSKGLEFDYVFMPFATEEAWIGRARSSPFVLPKKQASYSDVKDLRRLFYVALTRAREKVTVLTGLEESDGKLLSPLRFLSELDPTLVDVVTLQKEKSKTGTLDLSGRLPVSDVSKKLVDKAKNTLLEKGLSVTALNHFLTCPNAFLYQSILKLPQAPSASSEKGNAMHEALSYVWQSGSTDIEKMIIEKVRAYLKKSLLPTLEKKIVEKELVENAPIVAKALLEHFKKTKDSKIFTEHWVETDFEGTFGDKSANKNSIKKIKIPLHGKLDAIIDNGNSVSVFDYKTRKAMSEAAIRGDTKDADGGYFRQLVYYNLLLSGSPQFKNRKINTSLVFISPDEKGRCHIITLPVAAADLRNVRDDIQSLINSVWSGEIANSFCTDDKCEWCGLRKISNK